MNLLSTKRKVFASFNTLTLRSKLLSQLFKIYHSLRLRVPKISSRGETISTLCNDIFYDDDFGGTNVGAETELGIERGLAESANMGVDVTLDIEADLGAIESCNTGSSVNCTIQLV